MSRATLISGPTTLKFTAGGRKQGKNSETPIKNPWNPPRLGSKPENPQGRVGSRLFSTWPSTCQSIKMIRRSERPCSLQPPRSGDNRYRWSHARVNRLKSCSWLGTLVDILSSQPLLNSRPEFALLARWPSSP